MSVVSNGGSNITAIIISRPMDGPGSKRSGSGLDESMMKVINNPIGAQTEGIDDAPEGKSFEDGRFYQAVSKG